MVKLNPHALTLKRERVRKVENHERYKKKQ